MYFQKMRLLLSECGLFLKKKDIVNVEKNRLKNKENGVNCEKYVKADHQKNLHMLKFFWMVEIYNFENLS